MGRITTDQTGKGRLGQTMVRINLRRLIRVNLCYPFHPCSIASFPVNIRLKVQAIIKLNAYVSRLEK